MDDSLVIYSSIFLLVIFIILYKFLGQSVVISLGTPIVIIALYFLNINTASEMTGGGFTNNIDLDVLTDMPDF